ncbi:TldD/PmbA family protein [Candidatus Bathyarchaeota archaeon]|nr:TldD/PmbA family protein [Candidatus Bathyarchaeota archaeon]
MRDVLDKIIEVASQRFGAEYAEVRAQELRRTSLTLKEGRVEAAKQGIEKGAALRVLVKGAWGFASVGSFDIDVLTEAISEACKMAGCAVSKLKKPIKLTRTKAVEDTVVLEPRKDPSEIAVEDKISLAMSVNDVAFASDKRVKGCTVNYLDLTGKTHFINTDGAFVTQDKLYLWLGVGVTAKEKGVFTYSREAVGSTLGYEVFDVETPQKVGEMAAERAVGQLEAKAPKGGTFPVILGPNVMGTLVHEAFGHLAEADLTLSGSIISDKLRKKVGSDVVTFYDDGTVKGAFGSFKYDDEGVPAQKTLLVKDGVIVGLMHSRETAHQFDAEPTGNARAEDFRVEPIIRMRNTYIQPRDHSFDELLEGVKFGYYLKSFRGGQANLDGTFQVGIQEAYEVVDGEVCGSVRDVSISGNTLETLLKVDAVGKEFELWPGVCGKGQSAFVSDGGAHTRVKEVIVGGSA